MKNISKILTMFIVASLALLVGCGGGGGGGSDTPTESGITVTSEAVIYSDGTMGFTIKADSDYKNLTVTSPTGYQVNASNSTTNYRITGPAIPNTGSNSIYKVFTFSYTYNNIAQTTNVSVSIPPNGIETEIAVTSPVTKYGDAYQLKYSSSNHLISVEIELDASQKSDKLSFVWHKDSESGTVIQGTDSISDNAEIIYRPKDTSVIPADVTTGTSREYNRGFKINSSYQDHYLYLVIKNGNAKLGSLKFYVDEPYTPPTPNN